MEASTTITTTAVKPSTTAAMESAATASTTVAAPMLGEQGQRQANECERSETCKKGLEQGGFPHIGILSTETTAGCPGGRNRLNSSYLYLEPQSKPEVVHLGRETKIAGRPGFESFNAQFSGR
jgi:hypothetical protein